MTALKSLLIVYPLTPKSLVDRLRKVYDTVHFYPGFAGNDYSGRTAPLPPDDVLLEIDTLLCFNLPSNLKHASQTPKLKLLQLVGAGAYQVTSTDYYKSFPADHPLILSNAAGAHVSQIGEHVIMSVLALTHKLQQIQDICRQEQRWAAPSELEGAGGGGLFIRELRTLTVGILAYGHLGREVARLMKAFGARVIACTRDGQQKAMGGYHVAGTGDKDGEIPEKWYKTGDKASLYEFLAESDILVNALPMSDETHHFLGAEEFKAMKNSAIVVNIGRGPTMDHDALVTALSAPGERTHATGDLVLGGAALDVTDPEPLPPKHPLFSLQNVILTPHVSWASETNFYRAIDLLEQNKARLDGGQGALNTLRGRGEFD